MGFFQKVCEYNDKLLIKKLLDEVFVISGIIKEEVSGKMPPVNYVIALELMHCTLNLQIIH